jgi:hypothetical protein
VVGHAVYMYERDLEQLLLRCMWVVVGVWRGGSEVLEDFSLHMMTEKGQ